MRNTANLFHILEQLVERFSQVKGAADLDRGLLEGKDVSSVTAGTLRGIKSWWDAKSAAELNDGMVLDETLGDMNMEFFDDVWLKDIFSQVDGQFDLNMQGSGARAGF